MNNMEGCHHKLTEVLPRLAEIVMRDSMQCNSLRNAFKSIQLLHDLYGLISLTTAAENEGLLKKSHKIFEAGASILHIIVDAHAETSVGNFQDTCTIHSILCTAFPTLKPPSIPKFDFNACPAEMENLLRHMNKVKNSVASISQLLTFFKDIFFNCLDANKFDRNEYTKVSTVLISAISLLEEKTNEPETNEDKFLLAFLIAVDKPFMMSLNALWLLFTIPELNLAYDVVFAVCKLILKVLVTSLGSLGHVLEFFLRNTCEPQTDEIFHVIKEVQEASKHVLDAELAETDCDSMCINIESDSPSNSTSIPEASVTNESEMSSSINTYEDPIDATTKILPEDCDQSSHFCESLCKIRSISPVESAIYIKTVPDPSVTSSIDSSQPNSSDICDKSIVITPTTLNVCDSPFEPPDSTVKDMMTESAVLSTDSALSTSLTNEDDISVVHMTPTSEPEIFNNVNDVCLDAFPMLLRERLLELISQIQDCVGHFSFLKIGCLLQVICKICGNVLLLDDVLEHIDQMHPRIRQLPKLVGTGNTSNFDPRFNNKKVGTLYCSKSSLEFENKTTLEKTSTAASPDTGEPLQIMNKKIESEHSLGQIMSKSEVKPRISFTIKKKEPRFVPVFSTTQVFSDVKMNNGRLKLVSTKTKDNNPLIQESNETNSYIKVPLYNETTNPEVAIEVKSSPEVAITPPDTSICKSELKPDRSAPTVCGIAQSFYKDTHEDSGSKKNKKRKRNRGKRFSKSDPNQKWGSPPKKSRESEMCDYKMLHPVEDHSSEILNGSLERTGFISESESLLRPLKDIPKIELESLTDIDQKRIEILSTQLKFQMNHLLLKIAKPEISAFCKFCLKSLPIDDAEAHVLEPSHLHTLYTEAQHCTESQKEIPGISQKNWQFLEYIENSQSFRCRLCMTPLGNVISWVQHFQSFLHCRKLKAFSPNPLEEWLSSVTILRDSLKDCFHGLEIGQQERIVELIEAVKTELNVFSVEKSERLIFWCSPCAHSVSSKSVMTHIQSLRHDRELHNMRRNSRGQRTCQSSSDKTIHEIISCIKHRKGQNSQKQVPLVSKPTPIVSNQIPLGSPRSKKRQRSDTFRKSNKRQRSSTPLRSNAFQGPNIPQNLDSCQRFNASQKFDISQRLNVSRGFNVPQRFQTPQETGALNILHQYFVKPPPHQPKENQAKNLRSRNKIIQESTKLNSKSKSLRPKVLNHSSARALLHPDQSHSCRDQIPELISEVVPYQKSSPLASSSHEEYRIPVLLKRYPRSSQAVDINAVSSSINSAAPSLQQFQSILPSTHPSSTYCDS